jgi:outer membrane protease
VYGTGIVYHQTWYIPLAGVRATFRLGDRLDAGLALGFSPFLWMNDLDNHELRLLDFVGTTSGGFLLDPSLDVSWRFAGRARLSVELSYRAIRGLVGDMLVIGAGVEGSPGPSGLAPGEQHLYRDSAGASFDSLGIALSLDLSR